MQCVSCGDDVCAQLVLITTHLSNWLSTSLAFGATVVSRGDVEDRRAYININCDHHEEEPGQFSAAFTNNNVLHLPPFVRALLAWDNVIPEVPYYTSNSHLIARAIELARDALASGTDVLVAELTTLSNDQRVAVARAVGLHLVV